jgi:hypothetical protein
MFEQLGFVSGSRQNLHQGFKEHFLDRILLLVGTFVAMMFHQHPLRMIHPEVIVGSVLGLRLRQDLVSIETNDRTRKIKK